MSDNGKKYLTWTIRVLVTILLSIAGYAYGNHESKISELQKIKADQRLVERIEEKLENKADKDDLKSIKKTVDDIYLILIRKNK